MESLTKNFIKDFVQSRNIGDFSLVHPDLFIKNPHLLEELQKTKHIKNNDNNQILIVILRNVEVIFIRTVSGSNRRNRILNLNLAIKTGFQL